MATNLPIKFELDFLPSEDVDWVAADPTGHTFANSNGTVGVYVRNLSMADVTLTMLNGRDSDFGPHPDYTFVIPADSIRKTPTWDPRRFTSPTTGLATFTLSATATISVAAVAQQQIYQND